MTESELLNLIRKDPSAFSEVFKLYYKPIFGYIFRRTGDFDETADIASATFLKAFTHIKNFAYTGISVKVWLYRIATNEMNQFFRQRNKYENLFEKIDSLDSELFRDYLDKDKEELEAELQKHELYKTVLTVLKTLPARYQEVISLRYFEGKDNKEISMILSKNEGTIKSLISRGLVLLRNKCNQN